MEPQNCLLHGTKGSGDLLTNKLNRKSVNQQDTNKHTFKNTTFGKIVLLNGIKDLGDTLTNKSNRKPVSQ